MFLNTCKYDDDVRIETSWPLMAFGKHIAWARREETLRKVTEIFEESSVID